MWTGSWREVVTKSVNMAAGENKLYKDDAAVLFEKDLGIMTNIT